MKKRSIANRNFGAADSQGSLEGLNGTGGPVHLGTSVGQDSPTVAASPTLPASPMMPSMDIPLPGHHASHPLLAASIALGVILGLSVFAVLAWLGYMYHRRRSRQLELSPEFGSTPKMNQELFSASNVVEKGLRPRTSSVSSGTTIRPRSIMSTGGLSDGRRVSFIDVPIHTDSIIDLHDKIYGSSPGVSSVARSRMRSSTLSAIERSLVSSRPVSCVTISTLDPIEEETASIHSTTSSGRVSNPEEGRPDSMASTTSGGTSNYTTASARSSVSDLTTMSTISCLSAFPETPRSENRAISPTIETPTKSTWNATRATRARSQTVVNVKQIDLLRTAVGKTMSLQPSKQVVSALQQISAQQISAADNAAIIQELIRGREELIFSSHRAEPSDSTLVDEEEHPAKGEDEEEDCGDDTLVEDVREIDRPINGMTKVFFSPDSKPLVLGMDDETPTSSPVTRSRSFPSKLLARRRSESERNAGTRRSEVITGGYLKRALRALRGEDDMPPMPGSFFGSTQVAQESRRDSTDSTVSTSSQRPESVHTLDDVPFSPGWGYDTGGTEFDAYYMDDQDGFVIGSDEDEEEEMDNDGRKDQYRMSSAQLPHIRITSH